MTPTHTPPVYRWKRYEVRCHGCGVFLRWSWSPRCGKGRVKPLCAACKGRGEKGEPRP